MKNIENIGSEDLQVLENAVSQIAVLIAGADGEIDKDETDWAAKLMHIRSYSGDKSLQDFYGQVEVNFNIKIRDLVKNLSKNTAERQAQLSKDIAQVNPILAKLDAEMAYHIYNDYLTLAKSIAKSSGGILGFGAISNAESEWITLPMITPIAKHIAEDIDDNAEEA
jgi:hypothetical protein